MGDSVARRFVLALLGICLAGPAVAEDRLSPGDYQWLSANLNVARDSLALQSLTEAQQVHVHALIGEPKASPDKKLTGVADYIYRINGADFENTLTQSEH
jgi:hypothetical protein